MSENEILALEDKRFAAMTGKDWKALDALLHDQLLYTHSSGVTDTKAVWMDAMKGGRTVYTSMGVPEDFKDENFRRLLVNALFWSAQRDPEQMKK